MRVLIEFGAAIKGTWENSLSVTPLRRLLGRPGPSQFNCVKLLIEAVAQTEAIFSRAGTGMLTDLLRLSHWHAKNKIQDPRLYDLLAATSETTQKWIAILEVIAMARDGVHSLRNYVQSRLWTSNGECGIILELAMSEAVGAQQEAAVSSLLELGVDPRMPNLLHHGSINAFGLEWDPLLRAVHRLNAGILQLLLAKGANVHSGNVLDAVTRRDGQKGSILSQFAEHRDRRLTVVKCLLANGVDVTHKNGQNLLRTAMVPLRYDLDMDFVPDFELYETLTAAGIDTNLNHFDGQSLLHMALARGCKLATFRFLIDKNHAVHSRPDSTGHSMLQYARCRCRKNRSDMIQLVYEHTIGDLRRS